MNLRARFSTGLGNYTLKQFLIRAGFSVARNRRVRIEAEASALAGGAKLGPVTGEAEGEGAAAVSKATRALTEKIKLVCAR